MGRNLIEHVRDDARVLVVSSDNEQRVQLVRRLEAKITIVRIVLILVQAEGDARLLA